MQSIYWICYDIDAIVHQESITQRSQWKKNEDISKHGMKSLLTEAKQKGTVHRSVPQVL